jgi:hypothetical protein
VIWQGIQAGTDDDSMSNAIPFAGEAELSDGLAAAGFKRDNNSYEKHPCPD